MLSGGPVQHGPWLWQDCRAALGIGLEAGLLQLCRLRPDGEEPDLSHEAASSAPNDARFWVPPTDDGGTVTVYENPVVIEPWAAWVTRLDSLRA